jgi:hypothetical protein
MFKDGKELSDYEGNRSSASLVDFAKQHEIRSGSGMVLTMVNDG